MQGKQPKELLFTRNACFHSLQRPYWVRGNSPTISGLERSPIMEGQDGQNYIKQYRTSLQCEWWLVVTVVMCSISHWGPMDHSV